MTESEVLGSRARTKIVATIGPACQDRAILEKIVLAGVDICRLNMAHGSRSVHEQFVATIREAE